MNRIPSKLEYSNPNDLPNNGFKWNVNDALKKASAMREAQEKQDKWLQE